MSAAVSRVRCHLVLIAVALAFVILSLICQIAGFVAPGWAYDDGPNELHIGLWYTVDCKEGQDCKTDPTSRKYGELQFLEAEIEATIALVACMMAVLFLIVHMVRRAKALSGEVVTFLVVAIVCLISSGILAMIAAGTVGHTLRKLGILGATTFPYALFLTGLGGVLDAIIGLLLVLAVNHIAIAHKYEKNGGPTTHM